MGFWVCEHEQKWKISLHIDNWFFTQLMTIVCSINKNGQKTFGFGFGLKSAISLNNLRRLGGKKCISGFGTPLYIAGKPIMNFRH